jgi:peptidoglycan/xylan/chitin deacetylase (PgdA/CDA1 family)
LILCAILSAVLLGLSAVNASLPVAATVKSGADIPIIMYHQVCDNPKIFGDYVIPPTLLEEDFQYLKEKNVTPISFNHLKKYVAGEISLPEKCVIITFDDGERSFLTRVVPLLEKYGYPANVNIIGSLVEIYTQNGETDDRYAYLNRNDVSELAQNSLVEMGCHTYDLHGLDHRRGMGKLRSESSEQYIKTITNDLQKFNSIFEDLTGKKPTILAYPYGIRSNTLLETLKSLGFTVTLTCREETNTISVGDELLELGRFNRPYGKTPEEFFKEIGI